MLKRVVKSYRPWLRRLAIGSLCLFFALLAILLLSDERRSYVKELIVANWEHRLLQDANQGLQNENAGLRETVLRLEQTASLDKQATALLQAELMISQEEIYELKKELGFYKGIINATGNGKGVDVHGMRIRPLSQERSYRLELILIHVAKTDTMTEGVLDVALEGIQKNSAKHLSLSEITIDEGLTYDFRFRSFQRFENNFVLPENFKPQRVFVNLLIKGKEKSRLEKIFDWPSTVSREGTNVG